MKQLLLVFVGCTALYACSGGREQRAPVTDRMARRPDLTLPDTAARTDTSIILSSRTERPVTREQPVAQEQPQAPAAAPAKKKSASVRHRARTATPAPKKQLEDTAVRGYAPGSPGDTAGKTAVDTAVPRDSTPAVASVGASPSMRSVACRTTNRT